MGTTSHFRTVILSLVLVGGLLGCGADDDATVTTPTDGDCSSIEDWQDRLDCAYPMVEAHLEDDEALSTALDTLSAKEDRDMILYRLAFNHPTEAPRLCKKVQTEAFVEKCKQVMGRPHLGTTRKAKVSLPEHRADRP